MDRLSRGERLLSSATAALVAAAVGTTAVALFFSKVWHASPASLAYNVPIAAPFAVFFLDRLFPRPPPNAAAALDLAVIALALMRVFAPPLPFVSGHTLFAAYAALSACRWPLRLLGAVVLLQVIYMKLFVTGGAASMLGGLAAAAAASSVRRWLVRLSPARGWSG